jgi:hypothetical protein
LSALLYIVADPEPEKVPVGAVPLEADQVVALGAVTVASSAFKSTSRLTSFASDVTETVPDGLLKVYVAVILRKE